MLCLQLRYRPSSAAAAFAVGPQLRVRFVPAALLAARCADRAPADEKCRECWWARRAPRSKRSAATKPPTQVNLATFGAALLVRRKICTFGPAENRKICAFGPTKNMQEIIRLPWRGQCGRAAAARALCACCAAGCAEDCRGERGKCGRVAARRCWLRARCRWLRCAASTMLIYGKAGNI